MPDATQLTQGGDPSEESSHLLEIAMDTKKLTREEIALSILNGMIGSLFTQAGSHGAMSLLHDSEFGANSSREAIDAAFQMADLFIQRRDKAV